MRWPDAPHNDSRRSLLRQAFGISSVLRALSTTSLIRPCSFGQTGPCDPELAPPAGNPYGYQLRGERCEGIYIREVSSTALIFASFTSVFEDFHPSSSEDLRVQWNAPAAAEVRIRARTLDRRLQYRMDAVRDKGASAVLPWPSDLLHSLNIRKGNLAVLTWIPAQASPVRRDLYLPARVLQRHDVRAQRTLEVALLPGLELSEVYVSLGPVEQDGRVTKMLRDGEPLRYGYYPADRAVAFSIPAPSIAGIFYLEIAASLKSGGSVTLPVWFYNSPLQTPAAQTSGK